MCHSIKYRYWDRQGLHGELCASSAAGLFCTTASLTKGGHRAKRGCELPSNNASTTITSRTSPLLPFFTLQSPFPVALLSFYLWVHCFCIWLVTSCCYWSYFARDHFFWDGLGFFFGKFNSVLNQSKNDLLSLWACANKGDSGGRIMANWKIINIGIFFTLWDF